VRKGQSGNLNSTCTEGQEEKDNAEDAEERREEADLKIDHHIQATILLPDDDAGAWADFLETAGVPEDAVNEGLARGVVRSEENLDAIAGPFRLAWQEIGNAHWNAPLGADFVKEKICGETCFRIFGRCGRRFH